MRRDESGLSLVELVITVVTIGILMVLLRFGSDLMNMLGGENATAEARRDAQVSIFQITRDIRNAKEIKAALPDRLILNVFDTSRFDYSTANLFAPVNVGTVTYLYRADGAFPYLERTVESAGAVRVTKLFQRIILPPSALEPLFLGGPGGAPPYDSVALRVRLHPPMSRDRVLDFHETAVKRASRH